MFNLYASGGRRGFFSMSNCVGVKRGLGYSSGSRYQSVAGLKIVSA